MALWRRTPRLLGPEDLPAGFAYPDELPGLITGQPLVHWEWLVGERLSKASANLWRHHPRHLVPVAVRRDTTFVVCLDHSRVGPQGHEVVTIDALDAESEPRQHLPSLAEWVAGALEEEVVVAPPPPGGPWTPPETGRCSCVHHLEAFILQVVPFGALAPPDEKPRTVADLVMADEILVEPDFPGPSLGIRGRPVGPFHWRVSLVEGARWHYDDEPRESIEMLVQPNPGVDLVVRPEQRDFHLMAPTMCRDGVQTLFVRALLDDRARRKK
ncbi:hypothetical protein BH11ACT8_BH11ACT8_15980 [soil metagenome]